METQLVHEGEVALRYTPLVEEALDAKVGTMKPFDVMLIAGAILDDPEFFQLESAVKEEWDAQHPEIDSAAKALAGVSHDFALTAARRLTREQKLALRARIAAKGCLKLS